MRRASLRSVKDVARITHQMSMIRRFIQDESGATAIEYGMIASLIFLAIITSLKIMGPRLSTKFQAISGNLT